MKKKYICTLCLLISIICLFLSGCPSIPCATQQKKTKSVKHIGQVPDSFQKIVEKNLFKDVTAFDDRLLKAEISYTDEQAETVVHRICMMDLYGKKLAECTYTTGRAYRVSTLTATKDGGFLFTLGFGDYYSSMQDMWASEQGFASRVIKYDRFGNLQFDTPLAQIEGSALKFCFEKNGHFYFFGDIQTPETKNLGVYSRTDIYMTILGQSGNILESQCIAGSDFDSLNAAEISGDSFILSIDSQSNDGDFVGGSTTGYPVDWVITVNDTLEITDKKLESGRGALDDRMGEKNGIPIYKSNAVFHNFDAGSPRAFIDYGDFYLIVSENNTGIYENTPPYISSIWYYTETVYSAYDNTGNLIFRTSIDSSPDFDSTIS